MGVTRVLIATAGGTLGVFGEDVSRRSVSFSADHLAMSSLASKFVFRSGGCLWSVADDDLLLRMLLRLHVRSVGVEQEEVVG